MDPLAPVERATNNSSKQRDMVLDGFGGSGTTISSAEQCAPRGATRTPFRGVDVIICRWQKGLVEMALLEGCASGVQPRREHGSYTAHEVAICRL